jgi:hypothetical protein
MFKTTAKTLIVVAAIAAIACGGGSTEKSPKAAIESVDLSVKEILEAGTHHASLDTSDEVIEDGSHIDEWTLHGTEGTRVTVTMRSEELDSLLRVYDPMGMFVTSDDDGAGGLDATVTFDMEYDGAYTVVANTYGIGTGDYVIEMNVGSAPVATPIEYVLGGDPSDRYAVVVGVADYAGENNDLPVVAADVGVIVDLLTDRFGFDEDNILILRDDQATRQNILNSVLIHLGQAGAGGTALLYYSGHGTQREQQALDDTLDPEPDGLDEALAVYDGIILDDEIGFAADRLSAENVLLIFDSCFSGNASRGAGDEHGAKFAALDNLDNVQMPAKFLSRRGDEALAASTGTFSMLRNPQDHILLAGGAEDQVTFAPPSIGVSSFTYFLAEVMYEIDDSASFAEVMAEVHARASDWAAGIGEVQDPQAEGARVGESIGSVLTR